MLNGVQKYPHMFAPMTIKRTTFKNRVFAAPATGNMMTLDGAPTLEGIDTIETRARGGFAQLTLTETFADFEHAARHDHSIDLVRENMSTYHQSAIGNLTRAIKAHGCLASVQIQHVGGISHPDMSFDGSDPIGPSDMIRPDGVHVRGMTEEDIEHVSDNFAFAALRAKELGFDMVMIHCGHGWLLSQFLSPLSNKRTDRWGGSLENRARFTLLVLDKVRRACGEDFLIELRMSGDERMPGGMSLEDAKEFARLAQRHCDLIHVTSGIYHSPIETKWCSCMFEKHGCNLDLAAAIKSVVDIPVVAVGGFNDPQQIEDAIVSGKCDFVALGRQQYADPEFVNKTMRGVEDEISPCLRCSCFNPLPPDPDHRELDIHWSCAINPRFGNELRWKLAPQPVWSRKVLVIGGGVGGMQAAITAAERGHDVTLVEKSDRLGGVLWFADVDCHKEDLRRYRDSMIIRTRRAGVNILVNTEATPELIAEMEPDAVICAVGADPIIPPIPGVEHAMQALDAYRFPDRLGQRIVIVGGGLVGCELGYHLACGGKSVHIVEMQDDIAKDGKDSHRRGLIPRMRECMTWDVNTRCREIRPDGVVTVDSEGGEHIIQADTVLYATGMRARQDLALRLRETSGWFRPVGDCVRARLIEDATREGFAAAMDIVF